MKYIYILYYINPINEDCLYLLDLLSMYFLYERTSETHGD